MGAQALVTPAEGLGTAALQVDRQVSPELAPAASYPEGLPVCLAMRLDEERADGTDEPKLIALLIFHAAIAAGFVDYTFQHQQRVYGTYLGADPTTDNPDYELAGQLGVLRYMAAWPYFADMAIEVAIVKVPEKETRIMELCRPYIIPIDAEQPNYQVAQPFLPVHLARTLIRFHEYNYVMEGDEPLDVAGLQINAHDVVVEFWGKHSGNEYVTHALYNSTLRALHEKLMPGQLQQNLVDEIDQFLQRPTTPQQQADEARRMLERGNGDLSQPLGGTVEVFPHTLPLFTVVAAYNNYSIYGPDVNGDGEIKVACIVVAAESKEDAVQKAQFVAGRDDRQDPDTYPHEVLDQPTAFPGNLTGDEPADV